MGISDRIKAEKEEEFAHTETTKTEMSTDGPSSTKVTLSREEILKGIAALKEVVPWPTEKQTMPAYTDESSTIYLHFETKKANGPAGKGFLGKVVLPHFLSTKRSICVIARDMKHEEKSNAMIALLRELGVVGEIKTMPLSELQAAFREQDTETLDALVRRYDSHLAESYARQKIGKKMAPHMDQLSKSISWFDFALMKIPRRFGEETLGKVDLFVSPSNNGYIVRVGHTGFTDDELADNTLTALSKMNYWSNIFPAGLKHFTAVHLKTGITAGVPIFVNEGKVLDEPPRKEKDEEQKVKPAAKKPNRKRKSRTQLHSSEPFEKKLHLMDF